jgi:hypothetical protein
MSINANFPNVRPSLLLDFANSQQLDPRVTFSRSTTGVYYGNSSALAEQNLFIYSNTFSNAAWVATNATIASGVTDPFAGTTAFSMTATAGNATLYQTLTLTATPYTESIYIQRVTGTGTINLTLDGSTLSPVTITGSWVKYTYTATPSAGSKTIGIQIVTSGDAINIYGSQLENRSSVTATNITTISALNNYVPQLLTAPINSPRINFNPITGESLGLLLEQSSTNLFFPSIPPVSSFTFSVNVVSALANQNIAPDGTQTATQYNMNAFGIYQYSLTTLTSATTYTVSMYVKGTTNYVRFGVCNSSSSAGFYGNFDLINVTTTGGLYGSGGTYTSSTITDVGNGWYRCTVTGITGTMANSRFVFATSSTTVAVSYFAWNAQVEQLSFATSAIPTTSAQVTRAADTPPKISGTNFTQWFNYQQGTIYCAFDTPTIVSTAPNMAIWGIDNGTNAQYYVNKATATISGFQGGNSASFGTITANTNQQSIYSYSNLPASTSASGLLNGGSVGTITATQQSTLPTQLTIGGYITTSNQFTGHIKKLAFYPQVLTTAQLQALTGS